MGVRIQELPETTGIKKEDVLIVEDGQGTKKGTVQQLDETLGVSQLKEDLGELVNIDFEVGSTGFIRDDLVIVTTDEWNITGPIKVLKGAKYTFKSINYTAVSAITECDKDGNLLKVVKIGLFVDDNTPTSVSFVAERDMYVKLSYKNVYQPKFKGYAKIDELANDVLINTEMVGKIYDNTNKVIGKNRFNYNTSSDGYLSNDGSEVIPYEDWKTSDFIYVNDMKNVIASADYNGVENPLRLFYFTIYDADKNFIYQFNPMDTPYNIIDRVHYIRFSYHSNITNLQIEDNTVITPYSPYYEHIINKIWSGKKWTVVGDSLTEHNERTRFNYHDYISRLTGISVVNLGSSGKGYMNGGAEDAFYARVKNIPIDSDVVTIFGSGNDLSHPLGNITDSDTNTICGCINTTINNIITRMPRVSLGIIAPTPWEDYPPTTENNAMELYVQALKNICENRSIPFLDLYHESNLRPWTEEGRNACYSNDDGGGVHPDEYGHKLIAPRFKAFLETLII